MKSPSTEYIKINNKSCEKASSLIQSSRLSVCIYFIPQLLFQARNVPYNVIERHFKLVCVVFESYYDVHTFFKSNKSCWIKQEFNLILYLGYYNLKILFSMMWHYNSFIIFKLMLRRDMLKFIIMSSSRQLLTKLQMSRLETDN